MSCYPTPPPTPASPLADYPRPHPPPTPAPWADWDVEDKESFGCSRSSLMKKIPPQVGPLLCPVDLSGFADSVKSEPQDTNTGKYAWRSPRRLLWPRSNGNLDERRTPSYQEANLLMNMSGKKIHESKVVSSSLEPSLSDEMQVPTGSPSGKQPKQEILTGFPQMFEWSVTGPLDRLLQIMTSPLVLNEFVVCSGAKPELANLGEHGKKPEWVLMLKTQEPNFGVDIRYLSLIQGEQHVIIDEFRGGIDISHLLRWLDRYPVRVEVKGSSRPLVASKFWITSNLDPNWWYPDIDAETKSALMRRLEIIEFE